MDDTAIRKQDVPRDARPRLVRAAAVLGACLWAVLVIAAPETRPALLELFLGIALGIPAGLLYAQSYLGYLRRVAAINREAGWLEVAWLGTVPPPVVGAWGELAARGALLVFGLFGTSAILAGLCLLVPGLGWPWARFAMEPDKSVPFASIIPTALVYITTIASVTMQRVLRWYKSLTD